LGKETVAVLNLAAAFAHLAIELVAQNGEQPRFDVRAKLEAFLLRPSLHYRVLHEVIGFIVTTGQRERKRPEAWQCSQHIALERRRLRGFRSLWISLDGHWSCFAAQPRRASPTVRETYRGWSRPAPRRTVP